MTTKNLYDRYFIDCWTELFNELDKKDRNLKRLVKYVPAYLLWVLVALITIPVFINIFSWFI